MWETLFCSKSRLARRRHRGALLTSPSLSLSLSRSSAHTTLVLCQPFYCCLHPPPHPHFHLYPFFHFISMLILGAAEKAHVMSFIVMLPVYPSLQGENRRRWPGGGWSRHQNRLCLIKGVLTYMLGLWQPGDEAVREDADIKGQSALRGNANVEQIYSKFSAPQSPSGLLVLAALHCCVFTREPI